jgi:hypothetical protein
MTVLNATGMEPERVEPPGRSTSGSDNLAVGARIDEGPDSTKLSRYQWILRTAGVGHDLPNVDLDDLTAEQPGTQK